MFEVEEDCVCPLSKEEIDALEPCSRKSFLFCFQGEKSGVYKITNDLNDKIYIGSSKNIRKRFKNHIRNLLEGRHGCKHLQNFFNKHKEIHFSIHVIEECHPSIRFKREQFYLDTVSPFGERGFNMNRFAIGGNWERAKASTKKTIYQYNKNGLVAEFKCTGHASDVLGPNFLAASIGRVANGYEKTYRGFVFSYKKLSDHELLEAFSDKRKSRFKRPNTRLGVKRISIDGEEKLFENASCAAKEFGCLAVCINRACRKKVPYKGYSWEYLPPKEKPIKKKAKKPVIAIDKNGNILHSFGSITEAVNNGFDRNRITISCKKGERHKNLYWKYADALQ